MQYPEKPYTSMDAGELNDELEKIARELSAKYTELSEIRSQYHYFFLQAYKQSPSTSVSGRERDGEIATYALREDELRALGEIDALIVIRDLLTTFHRSFVSLTPR